MQLLIFITVLGFGYSVFGIQLPVKMMELPMNWKKIGERLGYDGWRKIKVKTFELPNGRPAEFDIISTHSFVTVAAFTPEREAILIRQYRPGPERELLSFAEGAIDKGEKPAVAARRELLEETGYAAGELIFLKQKNSAYTDQTQYFFLATNCNYQQEPRPDDSEFLTVELLPVADLQALILDPQDHDFCNIDAFFLAMGYLEG